jgi:hypothetical protein
MQQGQHHEQRQEQQQEGETMMHLLQVNIHMHVGKNLQSLMWYQHLHVLAPSLCKCLIIPS